MTEAEKKELIARLRARTDGRTMLACDPPRPAPDRDCHAAADLIEQHEAFRQQVSDAVEAVVYGEADCPSAMGKLASFILPKPDPLVEAVGDAMQAHEVYSKYELTDSLRAALAARGLKIVEDK